MIGTNLLQIATHEFGHVLGLGHSTAAGSVISPMYEGYITNFKLGKDDRAGIRELYGNYIINTPDRRLAKTALYYKLRNQYTIYPE